MELMNLQERSTGRSNWLESFCGKYKTLRRYLPAICILEVIIIMILLSYLFLMNEKQSNLIAHSDLVPSNEIHLNVGPKTFVNSYRIYSNGVNSTRLLLDLVNGCSQRDHDVKFTVACNSKDTKDCPVLETFNPKEIETNSALVVTTSRAGLRHQSKKVVVKKIDCRKTGESIQDGSLTCLSEHKTQLHIFSGEREQEIIGWGGALTDSTINNMMSLSTNGTARLLDDYFGEKGLMFNMVRITIGGSDFSSRFYTNNDLEDPNQVDFEMAKFRLREEDLLYKIPMLQQISSKYSIKDKELKIMASMWSPPLWMKNNHHHSKGFLKGSLENDDRYYKALANLKKNFLLAYKSKSINIWGLTIMNEPVFAVQPFIDFNTMIFPREHYGKYVSDYLGPIIKNEAKLKHVKLIAHDDNRRFLLNFTDPILSMNKVKRFIDGVSVHGYIDENYEMMDNIYKKHKITDKDFFILPNELCSGHLPFMEKPLIGNWYRGVHYALDIIRSLQHSASGWIDWNMALDVTGGPGWLGGRLDSPIIVDKITDTYHKSPMFYVMGHFSRYIPPKSWKMVTRMSNDKFDYHFETVTFLLPDKIHFATVILNQNPYEVELYIAIIDSYTNSESQISQQFVCAPESITTIVYSRPRYD